MASLNVTQDDMIDILIGHANAGLPINSGEQNTLSPPPQPQPPPAPAPLQNQSFQETFTELRPPPSQPQQGHHSQYLCPGCQQSILYTNRSSLVQLLSLHQQKCQGSQHYRYMCLECHSAFRTVVSLQEHESTCGGGSGRPDSKPNSMNAKPNDKNSVGTGGVIQSAPHGTNSDMHNSMNTDDSQTFGHSLGEYGSNSKFPSQFFGNGSTDMSERNKTVGNQSGVIQTIPGQQACFNQTTDEKDNDYKLPTSFYRPDMINTKDSVASAAGQLGGASTGGVIQSNPDVFGQTSVEEDSNKSHGLKQERVDPKEDDMIHSKSERSYELAHRNGGVKGQSTDIEENTNQEEMDSTTEGQRIYVRESWSQTYDQPKEVPPPERVVSAMLDEVSPAGRRRRACTRKMKVYNEKEMSEQKEIEEMESLEKLTTHREKMNILRKQKMLAAREARAAKELENPTVRKKRPYKKRKGKGLLGKGLVEKEIKAPKEPKPKKERKKRERKVKEKEPELEIPLQCQQCPKTFNRYSLYTKHYQMNHERAMCQYCGSQCIRRKLKSHEAAHLRQFKCTYAGCNKIVNSKHRLIRHSRIHTGEKPYTCEVCNKPFAGKENMVKHRKRVHEGEKPYQCRFCGRKFADTGRLKYHEGTHTKPRPTDYRCKFCGRGYKSHVGCYLHERTHTGNTVKCQYCGKAFMAKEHLKRHEYLHTGNYPFRCGNCQKGFKDHGSMRKHKCLAVL